MPKVPANGQAPQELVDFSGVDVVLTDSRAALEQAYRQGLSHDARIRTSAPALLFSGLGKLEPLEQGVQGEFLKEFQAAILSFTLRLYLAVGNTGNLPNFALVVARTAASFSIALRKAACLEEADFNEPRAFLAVDTANAAVNRMLNPPWTQLLSANPNFQTVHYSVPLGPPPGAADPDRLQRWRLQGIEYLGYRMMLSLWSRLPRRFARGQALVLKKNELIWETAYHLGRRGIGVYQLQYPKILPIPLDQSLRDAIFAAVAPVIRKHLQKWVIAAAREVCERMFFEQLGDALKQYVGATKMWPAVLDSYGKSARAMVLTSAPIHPEHVALVDVCRQRGMPVASFQHGVTREISGNHDDLMVLSDASASDIFFTYNETAARTWKTTPFWVHSKAVGLSVQHFRARHIRWRGPPLAPIFYVATRLYRGNVNRLQGFTTDSEAATHEIAIVEDVLNRLPHSVLYKPYENAYRYVDADPVLDRARKSTNINVFEDGVDLRYIVSACRVIVTARATSTLGWCIPSDKPLVFIDLEGDSPLTPEAYAAFKSSVFLFDGRDDDNQTVYQRLREFLSQPLATIDALWQEKAVARAELVERFFSVSSPSAGRRAADYLISEYYSVGQRLPSWFPGSPARPVFAGVGEDGRIHRSSAARQFEESSHRVE